MDTLALLERIQRQPFFASQICHIEEIPARKAVYRDAPGGLTRSVEKVLRARGVTRLYSHQARAIELAREKSSFVVVTGTASGKTLCYTVPTLETIAADSLATMLYIYPTKALAQDQLRSFSAYRGIDEQIDFVAGAYDGDTPQNLRRKLRDDATIILTNPDMLHQGVLPQHSRWNRFFSHLKLVVIDEVHAYRGVFGSHLANVLRRLRRVCRHYGADPQCICSSATIANPGKHAENICGVPMAVIDQDGAPRGPKRFVMWNPPSLTAAASGAAVNWRTGGDRRSPVREAVELLSALVKEGVQTIAFVRTRLAAELIFKSVRDLLQPVSRRLADSVHAYRGGYLPEERREIERKLAGKEILGVASTNALELGIDIGSLDACVLVGYPGTIASLWQQAGRAGRGRGESLVMLVGQNAPIDQYFMAHAEYLFSRNPEQAVVDPDNPHIVIGHLKCAANELPLSDLDAATFGPYAEALLGLLEEDAFVKHIQDRWYWANSEFPAATVNLRNIAGPVYTIQDSAERERVIGTIDEMSALAQLHDHAVYLHGAETYFVEKLDIEQKIAFVYKTELDYYTQSVQSSQIAVDEKEFESDWLGGTLGFGDVTVTTTIPMFKKIKFHSRDSLGFEQLELPPQSLETVAFWYAPPPALVRAMERRRLLIGEALIGVANVLVEIAPLFVMCDQQDIGVVADAVCLGRDALFVHDRYPGGMGFARRCLDRFGDMMQTIAEVVRGCGCEDGCPSCVGAALPPFAATDLDSAVRGRIPNKEAAGFFLDSLLG